MFCVMMFTVTFAQTESEHLTFKGIPIDGSLKSFVEKMKQKGFTYQKSFDNTAVMEGAFSGYNDCRIYITSMQQKDLVHTVGVVFPIADSWNVLSSNYFVLKGMLSTKYGEPFESIETFDSYSQPRDDQMRMLYAKMDKCKYESTFKSQNGLIMLKISHIQAEYTDVCNVSLIYIDLINYGYKQAEAIDDL